MGATPACTGFPLEDDEWSDIAFPGGVTLTFGGVSISSVRAYTNGMLAFATNMHRSTTPARRNWPNVTGGTINARTSIVAGAMAARYSFANESRVTFGLSDNNTGALNIDLT